MYITARVVDVVLSPSHQSYGDGIGIGYVLYDPIESYGPSPAVRWAAPLMGFLTQYPLIGEYVAVMTMLASADMEGINTTVGAYYLGPLPVLNNPVNNQPVKETTPGYVDPKTVSELLPMPGDLTWQGRNEQTFRMGADADGHPISIWGIGGTGKNGVRSESPDDDATIIVHRGGGQIQTKLSYENFSGYNPDEPAPSPFSVPVVDIPQSQQALQPEAETPVDPYPVRDDSSEEPDQEKLDIINVGTNVELPRQTYTPIERRNPLPIASAPRRDVSFANYKNFVGEVGFSVIRPVQALLDVIAYAEGTMGQGENGYDIIIGYGGNTALKIANWTPNYAGRHPFPAGKGLYVRGTDGRVYHTLSTASGRYQFLAGTWNAVSGGKTFSQANQDKAAELLVTKTIGIKNAVELPTLMKSPATARPIVDMLARQWDSLPYSPNGGRCYAHGGRGADHHRLTVPQICILFQQAYAVYTDKADRVFRKSAISK